MKKVILLLCLIPVISLAQKQNNQWYFGQNAALDFNSGTPVPVTTSAMFANEGCASIADKKTGALLFYTNGVAVWDRNNNYMPNGYGLGGNTDATQSAVIVPMPGSDSLYYIFTMDAYAGSYGGGADSGLEYSIVDMSLNGGLGDVSSIDNLLLKPATEKLCATLACNGTDIWIAAHLWNSDAFYTYLISSKGISTPVISHTGVTYYFVPGYPQAEAVGSMKFSPNGEKLALVTSAGINLVQICDFDKSTGVVSNAFGDFYYNTVANSRSSDEAYGVSFSPDNTKLYVSHFSVPNAIYQYDLTAGDSTAIVFSRTIITSTINYAWSALQNGPDGKMYLVKSPSTSVGNSNDSLDVINNPNEQGSACNYVSDALYLGGAGVNRSSLGLPNIIESMYSASPVQTVSLSYSTCRGDTAVMFDNTHRDITSWQWNFGDTSSHLKNISSGQTTKHSFSSSGAYAVSLVFTSPCGADTLVKTIQVDDGPLVTITPPSSSFCVGTGVRLTATGGTTYTWSPQAGLNATTGNTVMALPDSTTAYTVTVTSATGCSAIATDTISVLPSPSVDFNYTINQGNVSFAATNKLGGITRYHWDFGDSASVNNDSTPSHTFARKDTFYVCLTVYNNSNCSYTFCKYVNTLNTGIKDKAVPAAFQLYPNPAGGQLTVSSEQLTGSSIEIKNMLGQTLITQVPLPNVRQTHIDISSLPAGVYLLEVKSVEGTVVKKFVKD